MIVSFPMYTMARTRLAQAEWWTAVHRLLKKQGIDSPPTLTRVDEDLYGDWLNPDLLLSQTCGYPLVSRLKESVKLVGTPEYQTPNCLGADYCSYLVVKKPDRRQRLEDYAGSCLAFNGLDSQSGFNALRQLLLECNLPIPFFGKNICSGSHKKSLLAVASGRADMCAVDCVTHSLLARHQPEVIEHTRVLRATRQTPGLPLIASVKTPDETVAQLFGAINSVCHDPRMEQANKALLIKGLRKVGLESYRQAITIAQPPLTRL